MTEQQIDWDRIRKLADAAARGPWEVDDGGGYDFSVTQGPDGDYIACDVTPRDAAFIAATREAVPALLDRIARLEAQSYIRGRAVVIYQQRAGKAERERDWNLRSSRLAKKGRIEANARADRAEARIKAVRELHSKSRIIPGTPVFGCAECGEPNETEPCATIRALDG